MTLAYRAASFQQAGNASSSSIAINKPAGGASGDIFVTAIYLETDTNTITGVPTGWTLLGSITNTGSFTMRLYALRAGGSEPATYTWTFNAAGWNTLTTVAYSGGTGTGTLLDLAAGSQADAVIITAQTAPSITTTGTARMVVFAYGNFSGTNVTTMTGFCTNLRGSFGGCTIADAVQATAAATGTSRPSAGPGGDTYAALHAAIISDTGGGAASDARVSPLRPYFHLLPR
jgi:hypothetical protein